MDILDKIKQFINDSIQSLFIQQKEEISHVIHKEALSAISDLKSFIGQQVQINERDMANMHQMIFSQNHNIQNLIDKLESIQKSIDQLKEFQVKELSKDIHGQTLTHEPRTRIYYAKMVDSENPLGFKIDNLKSDNEGCAFKITLKDETEGFYEIVNDEEIHQEVLAAFNPLITDSSVYENLPQNPTRISIIQSGKLVKENHVLRIINKQKIMII